MHSLDDTIAAVASAPGGAARGILRLSGPDAVSCAANFFERDNRRPLASPERPRVFPGMLRLPPLHSLLPCDACVWPEGRSYTGQQVVELHTFGSPPLLDIVLRSLCAAGARLAGPGEFTLRAFLAGRIDLTQAEAVLGVIDAADPSRLRTALRQLAGGLATPLHRLRDNLLELLAHLEAGFDFADEPLPFLTADQLSQQLLAAESDIAAILRHMDERAESTDIVTAVFVGRPNTGKSSLFNALVGDAAALVADGPGTTRDYLTAEIDLEGVRCRLVDTAGAAEADNHVEDLESVAQQMAAEQHQAGHLHLLCLDSTRPLDCWERALIESQVGVKRLLVLTKADLPNKTDLTHPALPTSVATGQGIDRLQCALREMALAAKDGGEVVHATAVRCRDSLRLAAECMACARQTALAAQEELAAAELRLALDELGKVVGAVYTDDILDRIFSRFCIGK